MTIELPTPRFAGKTESSNENCLQDICCPACGYEERFAIEIRQIASVEDDGVQDLTGDNEWDDDSWIRCDNEDCFYAGTVKEFTIGSEITVAPPDGLLAAAKRLVTASAKIGNLDHAGIAPAPEDWAEMYAANCQLAGAIAKAEGQ